MVAVPKVPEITWAGQVAARPIGLAIIEGVHGMARGRGAVDQGTRPASPGVMIAGTNALTADAVVGPLDFCKYRS